MQRLLFYASLSLMLCACAPPVQYLDGEPEPCHQIGFDGQTMALCPREIIDPYISYAYPRKEYSLVSEAAQLVNDGSGDSFQIEALDLIVSPTRRYLAVIKDGGEGHSYFYVMDLDDVRKGKEPRKSQAIEAYPGFYDLRWQGDKLAFESEANLVPSEGECTNDEFGCTWNYLLNPENNQLEKVGKPVPND